MGDQKERRVQIHLLGGVSASTDTGKPLDLGPAKCRAVLAALALSVGDAVPVTRLIDVIWGERPPRTAEKTLQGYVAQLRKAVGPDAIVRTGEAYRLTVEPEYVDVVAFRRLLGEGDVEEALACWGGTPLAGLDTPGLAAVAAGLTEQWLAATEQVLGKRVIGDPAAAVAPLTELTATHPFREELWALLMTALYRTGRQADALAAFQRARDHMVDELGIEPGPRLRELETKVLGQVDPLQDTVPAPVPSPGPGPARPSGTVTFAFAEVADATRLWVDHRRKMAKAMARLDTLIREVSARHDGTVVVSAGESFGVAFHRAEDAAQWATELQVATDQEPWPGGTDVRLQVALHTGETAEHEGSYFGPAVHVASRLAAAAHGGQTLVSAITAALLERDDLRDLGTHRLDGVVADHDVLQLDDGEHPPLRTASVQHGNLPRQPVRLLGRGTELDAITQAMESFPVVTLVGPGGIGKTALALAAARRSQVDDRRRVWFVDLAEITDPADVPRVLAETLGVTGGAGRTLTESVVAASRSRATLLLLDNCEHVIDGASAFASAIVEDGGSTRVLATSRESLDIPGEHVVSVPPLDPTGAAVELFVERARAATGSVDVEIERETVEDICRRLDGLPLAIELAAARTATLTPEQLLARLDDRLRLLTGSRRASAGRHRTLRATVRWSYDLLSRPEQLLFERLAVFAGPFDLAAAEAVAAGGDLGTADVDLLLGDLVERSMVAIESGPFGRRFRMLETLRQFAAEQLGEHGDPHGAADRLARWCRDEVQHIGALLQGHGEIEGVARLAELWPNLRAAVDQALATSDVDLADTLVRPIAAEVSLRRQIEIADWAERILELLGPDDEARTVFWLLWACHRHAQAGDRDARDELVRRHGHADHPLTRFNDIYVSGASDESQEAARAAATWLRDRGEDHAADLVEVGGVAGPLLAQQRFADLEALAATMAERHRRHGPPTLRYFALGMQGYAAQYQGRHEDAARYFAEATQTELPAGTYRVIQTVEARMAFEQGDRARAYRLLRDNIDTLLDSDYTDVTRMVAIEFITIMAAIDRLPEAAHVLPYLDTTGDFATLAREQLIVDAVERIDADPSLTGDPGRGLDVRGTLTFMRDVLDELLPD
jgi:predicted ATPase/DNA-binding SARP family transcriptional activator/class 3 adenylate cyclase